MFFFNISSHVCEYILLYFITELLFVRHFQFVELGMMMSLICSAVTRSL